MLLVVVVLLFSAVDASRERASDAPTTLSANITQRHTPTGLQLVETEREDETPNSLFAGVKSTLRLTGGEKSDVIAVLHEFKASNCTAAGELVQDSLLTADNNLQVQFEPKLPGEYRICYKDYLGRFQLLPYTRLTVLQHPIVSSIMAIASHESKPINASDGNSSMELHTQEPMTLSIAYYDKDAMIYPVQHMLRNVWFSSENLRRPVIFKEGLLRRSTNASNMAKDHSPDVWQNNTMIVAKMETKDQIKRTTKFLASRPNNTINIGLFQIGDYNNDKSKHEVYKHVDYVFRMHRFNSVLNSDPKIHWLPHGVTDNFVAGQEELRNKKKDPTLPLWQRSQLCSFMGWECGGEECKKTWNTNTTNDRQQMLAVVRHHPICYIKVYNRWAKMAEGNHMSDATEYIRLLYSSKFSLCPNNLGAETFRLYESIEAGSVPVLTYNTPESQSLLDGLPDHDNACLMTANWNDLPAKLIENQQYPEAWWAMKRNAEHMWAKLKCNKQKEVRDALNVVFGSVAEEDATCDNLTPPEEPQATK